MPTSDLKEKIILIIVGLLAVVIAALVFGYVGSFFAPENSTEEKIEEISSDVKELKKEVKVSDYSRKDVLKKITIVTDFRNSVKNSQPTEVMERKLAVVGKISYGYLHVKASVNNNKLSLSDSVYVKLAATLSGEHKEFGGHLRRDKSLNVPPSESITELLYSLDNIFYKTAIPYSEDVDAQSVDFLRALNDGTKTRTIAFVSTLRNGIIHELSIYYECQEKDECSIVVVP